MPPKKKKLTNTGAKRVTEQNKDEYSKSEFSVTNFGNMTTYLSSLPTEILSYISKFLSPADLVSLSQLDDPRFREVAQSQREANFSVCRRSGVELLSSFFTRESVKHIQKLNFNGYFYAKPCDLVQVICRCKKLVNLSIIECGITYKQLLKILSSCSLLDELSCSITESSDIEPSYQFSVKKLLLLYESKNISGKRPTILKNFPCVESAIIYCFPDTLTVPPFTTSWPTRSYTCSSSENFRWISVMRRHNTLNDLHMSKDVFEMFGIIPQSTGFLDFGDIEDKFFDLDHPPFFKIMPQENDMSYLSSCSSRTYSSVNISLNYVSFDVYDRLFNAISKVIGSQLKHLSIECRKALEFNEPYMEPVIYAKIADLLGKLFLNCKNITVLNFGSVHFSSGSPFEAMCNLKNLKFLNIPTCAFPEDDKSSAFQELVSKCCNVEEFHLVCCIVDKVIISDITIYPVQNWKELVSLAIYSVNFTPCRFLRKIADHCPKFESFSLIDSPEGKSCIFYEDVIYLLKNAKNLTFLRINCYNFNPQFERLWNAVSLAKNLEAICFLTNLDISFNISAIINSISSLKYLHSFHFQAPRVSDRLYTEVKKSMVRNNIKNAEIAPAPAYWNRLPDDYIIDYHMEGNFIHFRPKFVCQDMHFKKFLFDSYSYFDIK